MDFPCSCLLASCQRVKMCFWEMVLGCRVLPPTPARDPSARASLCLTALPPQIQGMKERLESWCTDVKSMEMLVEHQAHDVLT